jgi:galactokinase
MRDAVRPVRTYRAPGRVNLIGGQVDYHEGFVVSMAIDREVHVAVRRRDDGSVLARSGDLDGHVVVRADGADEPANVMPKWGRLVAGVVRTLADAGRIPIGADLDVTSSLPIRAGLSSSAAFEVAVALSLAHVGDLALAPRDLMLLAQRAEHIATGVPCGVQDQMSSVFGVAGHALLIDCRTLEVDAIALPPDVAVLIVHSGIERALEDTPYARRRAESLAVAQGLGLRSLRDARPEQVVDEPRGRHAVSEIHRVVEFAEALTSGDIDRAGRLMLASHASSRDDMEVSTPELDILVEALTAEGAYGARLTGAGFGGCVVALVPVARAHAIATNVKDLYARRTERDATSWIVNAAEGAGPLGTDAASETKT